MKIVQSFWSCQNEDILNHTFGWYSPKFHLMSWALSSLQLTKYYKDVELYTDKQGYEMLIEKLQLPYSKVHVVLDEMNGYHPKLWALPKIKVYGLQDEPFLHIDGDVFIWEPFAESLIKSEFIVQNLEKGTEHYGEIITELEENLVYFPEIIVNERKNTDSIYAYNAGIFGGHDIPFFKSYTKEAFRFVDNNAGVLSKINVHNFNIFFEQFLFYCLLKKTNREPGCLLEDLIYDVEYKGMGDFEEVPYSKKFLHLLGSFKRDLPTCKLMERRLRQDYPEYYKKVVQLFEDEESNYVLSLSANSIARQFRALENDYSSGLLPEKNEIANKDNNQLRVKKIFKRTIDSLEELLVHKSSISDLSIDNIKEHVSEINLPFLTNLFNHELLVYDTLKPSMRYSSEYLLARDLASNRYYEFIFDNSPDMLLSKVLVKDETISILFSTLRVFDLPVNLELAMNMGKWEDVKSVYMAIIPEEDGQIFTEAVLDELDCLILEILEMPKSINELLNELVDAFDEEELNGTKDNFHKLIFIKLKSMIFNRCIRIK